MTNLVRIAPGALTIGKPLPWTVYDTDGKVLLRQGYVIQNDTQLEQLFERGLFQPRRIERPQDEAADDAGARNPFTEYPLLLQALETSLAAITRQQEDALRQVLELSRDIDRICQESPEASLALVHLYSIEPTIHEQILFHAILCQFTARQFGLDNKRTAVLVSAALTANLALVPVADKLNASSRVLTDDQRAVIRRHPQRSIQALKEAGITSPVLLRIIAQHHEQADGSGYPAGLSGTDIRGEAEILALAERYVAMITRRAYRARMSVVEARRLITSLADGKFRPAIPRALLAVLTGYPPGTLVRLANNEVAVIVARPHRHRGPHARAIIGTDGGRYGNPPARDCSQLDFNVVAVEQPEIMPSMDFGLLWGFH